MASADLQQHHHHQHARDQSGPSDVAPGLLGLLSNTLVLYQVVPYLPFQSIVNLAATSRAFSSLLHNTPGVFRHLDLTKTEFKTCSANVARLAQDDDSLIYLTEDEVYSRPLRHVFSSLSRHNILQDVNTLVLDGLSVTFELINDILIDPSLHIRILSIRDVKNLNERRLQQALRYACRPTRPENTPRLKALYYFGNKHNVPHVTAWRSSRARSQIQDSQYVEDWYSQKGRVINSHIGMNWAETILDCRDILHFDAVLCTSPHHRNSSAFGTIPSTLNFHPWAVATYGVGGCASCGSAPEGFTVYGDSPRSEIPLLTPIPLHSSTVKSATCPSPNKTGIDKAKFIPRCTDCILERYCHSCNQWWCETCYELPSREEVIKHNVQVDNEHGHTTIELSVIVQPYVKMPKITRSCWECEHNCLDCIAETQKRCRACGGGYCIIHYEGSTLTMGVRGVLFGDVESCIKSWSWNVYF